jgi:hypothetical protein
MDYEQAVEESFAANFGTWGGVSPADAIDPCPSFMLKHQDDELDL